MSRGGNGGGGKRRRRRRRKGSLFLHLPPLTALTQSRRTPTW